MYKCEKKLNKSLCRNKKREMDVQRNAPYSIENGWMFKIADVQYVCTCV